MARGHDGPAVRLTAMRGVQIAAPTPEKGPAEDREARGACVGGISHTQGLERANSGVGV